MLISHGAAMFIDRLNRLASIPALVLSTLFLVASALPSAALGLLRDADIEHGLSKLAAPVLTAAGLNAKRVRVLVVNDASFNAFVVDSQTIFVNYGLILKVTSPEMLQAVIGHEAAHIANGHLSRRMQNMRSASSISGLGVALAVLAAAAGAGEAAAGIAVGTQSAAFRSFLAHTRAEESSADRSAAGYLTRAGISPQGLVDLHQVFSGQDLLSTANQDPYMRSHPLSRDRLRAAKAYVASFGDQSTPNAEANYWFARVRGKLSAFNRSPKWTKRRAKEETSKDIRLMREAVAFHRQNNLKKSLTALNGALAQRPNDAYYYELKGQILMENRRWSEALTAYRRAVDLAPSEALILGGYGRALLAAGQPKQAIQAMEKARARDFRDARLLRDMSLAYAKTGRTGMAALVTAERYALQGRMDDAGRHAKRASALLPRGSATWRRAQDVLIAAEQYQKRKNK
ncbi:M48 family metalloprotease [Parasedimentitalea psychrophila]|uniref:M48 family metalloprotease n=1 Tax=Parasedimentitalea psychrophila TaxID=2997337 RepID=A0A9Y2KXR9_9RHOB|nr:M48 family metalloprotease [Parasedimentitalea psychrophila]WIY25091.1 M48 family metalloprotease [Parasedimentitalea psychrophila]